VSVLDEGAFGVTVGAFQRGCGWRWWGGRWAFLGHSFESVKEFKGPVDEEDRAESDDEDDEGLRDVPASPLDEGVDGPDDDDGDSYFEEGAFEAGEVSEGKE
jgi:hypothetical protein